MGVNKVPQWACVILGLFFCLPAPAQEGVVDVEQVFRDPPAISRPGVWWHWMGCNVSREGITRDLEALKDAGFGSATIFGMADTCTPWPCPIPNSPTSGLVAFTDPWWKLVAHAASEAKRLNLDLGVHNCPGYTHSGGPWIPPELSMMEICSSSTPAPGGKRWSGILPRPVVDPRANTYYPSFNEDTGTLEKPVIEGRKTFYRDIAVLALPASGVVRKDQIIDLTAQTDADGKLAWDVPAGEWIVYRMGYTTMGSMTMPNQWQARGLECDKMSVAANEFHVKRLLDDMKRNLGDLAGSGLKHVLFDSYEAGTPNWTPKMPEEFAQRRGYPLRPFLATFAKRVVGSDAETGKFRADFDRTRWELYRDAHFATVSRLLRQAGLQYACEPYVGPWQVGDVAPHVGRVMTEFWANSGRFEGALVGVNGGIMNGGHNILDAEAFTCMPAFSKWTEYPDWLKPVGDGAFCAGINRLVLHEYAHQPWDSRFRPGATMGLWGTHFGRLQTWWEPGKAWVAYLGRCQALLQWGKPASGGFRADAKPGEVSLKCAHRNSGNTDVFFVANQSRIGGAARCVFAVTGMTPELWDPVTGAMRPLHDFSNSEKDCTVTLEFAPAQSWFVVFRKMTIAPVAANFPIRKPVGEAVAGPWTVRFDPTWGGPGQVEFAQLDDWTKRPEPGIRYYSGTAGYRSSFTCTASTAQRPCFLDLGQVKHLARVRINGRDLGVVWTAPWGVTIPIGLLKDGQNTLEIDVTNVWANRLIGDEQEPDDCQWLPGHIFGPNLCGGRYLKQFPDWFVKNQPRPSKGRYCFTTWNYFTKDSQPVSSGLLGPVRLLEEDWTARQPPATRPSTQGLPDFESDQQADRWLRERSSWYRSMAEDVDRHGGYSIGRTTEMPGGVAYFMNGRGYIELNDVLKGAHRVSVLIFELTNLYQEPRHREATDRVRHGQVDNPAVFGLWREMIEYDGLRLHRDVLLELKTALGTVPPEMITWVSSTAKTFAEYQLPFAYVYLKAQEASGHTAHYIRLFEKHRAEYLDAMRKEKAKNAPPTAPTQ